MAKLLAIVGESGSGKTRSFNGLDASSTYIINVQGKPLPWRGSGAAFSTEKKNITVQDNWTKVYEAIQGVATNRTEIKNIIIDDAGFIMSTEYFKRASEGGYNKFSEIGQHMFNIVDLCKKLRNDLNIIFTFHPEVETDILGRTSKKIKTVGKMLDNSYTLEGSFTVVLYTQVTFDKDGQPSYQFVTNRTPDFPAKSPEGMFDSLTIENDLKSVLDKVEEYYN